MKKSTVFERSIAVNNNKSIRISYIMLKTRKMDTFLPALYSRFI